jgi:hypothetical protein
VYRASQTIAQTGWVTFNFSTPFAYDGTSNLLVDFSFNNSSASSGGAGFVFTSALPRTLAYSTDSAYGDPLFWSGLVPFTTASTAVPQIKFNAGLVGPTLSPAVAFLGSGSWTGTVSVNGPIGATFLAALDFIGGAGQSSVFSVQAGFDSDGDGLPDAWEAAHGLASGNPMGAFGALGDLDLDGVPNLLEYAFNLDPGIASMVGLPISAFKINPADGLEYVEFTYRRRTGILAISYTIQTSEDCIAWSNDPSKYEVAGPPVPLGDGFTELVTVRILPSLNAPGHPGRFVRLLISTP